MTANPFDGTTKWIWSREGIAGARPDTGRYRIRHFRRVFDAPAGATLTVHVSADSRYRLWCNGIEVAFGPGRPMSERRACNRWRVLGWAISPRDARR
mgnify:CR=1 FL=1